MRLFVALFRVRPGRRILSEPRRCGRILRRHQQCVDQNRPNDRLGHAGINRLRNGDVAYESYRVEKCNEEDGVRHRAINESDSLPTTEPPIPTDHAIVHPVQPGCKGTSAATPE